MSQVWRFYSIFCQVNEVYEMYSQHESKVYVYIL